MILSVKTDISRKKFGILKEVHRVFYPHISEPTLNLMLHFKCFDVIIFVLFSDLGLYLASSL